MADLALGSVKRIFRAGLAIKKAVKTVRQNKKECRDIEKYVARVSALLSLLDQGTGLMKHPAMSGPLDDLADSLEEALELIVECQERNALRHFLVAGDMAKRLLRVRDDILGKLALGNFACTVQMTITPINTIRYGGARPLLTQMQDLGDVVNSCSSQLASYDVRSGINSQITMVATGSDVLHHLSSRSTESKLPELEATTHNFWVQNGGRGHSFILKQKIVFQVTMPSDKSRSKALALVASTHGVSSMGITGDLNDRLEVVGDGVDLIFLLTCLRKKLGHADIILVEQVKKKKPEEPKFVLLPQY